MSEAKGSGIMNKTTKAPTRRVINTADDDVWSRLEDEAEAENYGVDGLGMLAKEEPPRKKKKKRRRKKRKIKAVRERSKPDIDIRTRHQRSQKAQRLFKARMRALAAFVAALVIIAAVVFLTPVFNVRSISVSGNTLVSAEEVSQLVGDVKGTNLFLASKSSMEKQLKTIKYIDEVEISKSVIPPAIDIAVTEHVPVGYAQIGEQFLLLDRNLYIIDASGGFDLNTIPCIVGIKVKKSEVGSALIPENEEVGKAVRTFLDVMSSCGEVGNVVSADFGNMNNITFNYGNRITVFCGTQIDLERRLRLFCVAIQNENIGPDARGTIEFNDKGEAIYTP